VQNKIGKPATFFFKQLGIERVKLTKKQYIERRGETVLSSSFYSNTKIKRLGKGKKEHVSVRSSNIELNQTPEK
jgi:hypothetical protein